MANKNIAVKHIQRNDTKANWLLSNPILSLGELGIETDTFKIKIGNGVDNYANLPYLNNSTVSKISTQKVVATVEGQTEFDIPFDDFNSSDCYIDVRINSVWINPEKYTINGKKLILKDGRKNGTEVFFTCHYLENHASNDGSVMKHTHTISDITDFPKALPADGGNADTLGGKSSSDFATATHTHTFPVTSVAGRTGAITLTKADVGLGSVPNYGASTSVSSTSTTTLATSSAVKQAYDKAVSAYNKAYNITEEYALTPSNGWVTDSYFTPPKATKIDNFVFLSGVITGGTTANGTVLFNLPSNLKPTEYALCSGTIIDGQSAKAIRIDIAGTQVRIMGTGLTGSYIPLSGISWKIT